MEAESAPTEVPQKVLDFLASQQTMTLATASGGGVPHAGTFMFANDGPAIYFWARPHSTTAKHIQHNPVVALAVSEYYEDDPRKTKGVQATGECSVVLGGDEIIRALELFGEKFTTTSSGASTTNISFFRIKPTELYFIDNSGQGEGDKEEFGLTFEREVAYSALSDLPEGAGATLTAQLQTIEVPAGDVIVREGAPAEKFFIVLEGAVELVREGDSGQETLAKLTNGQFFGEAAILRDAPRSATVKAVEDSKLMVMDGDTFRSLVASSLGTSEDFGSILRDRIDILGG
jgi:uncharacterized protein YhbP (UPF0306 family)